MAMNACCSVNKQHALGFKHSTMLHYITLNAVAPKILLNSNEIKIKNDKTTGIFTKELFSAVADLLCAYT